MKDERQLEQALRDCFSGVRLSPRQIRRITDAATAGPEAPRRPIPAWAVGLAVTVTAVLWPLTAFSERLL